MNFLIDLFRDLDQVNTNTDLNTVDLKSTQCWPVVDIVFDQLITIAILLY